LKNGQNQSRTQNSARILAKHSHSDYSACSGKGTELEDHVSLFLGSVTYSAMLVHKIA